MAIERTLSILKPDSVEKNHVGEIIAMLEAASLRPIAIKRTQLTRAMAEGFYAVHRERKFFGELALHLTTSRVSDATGRSGANHLGFAPLCREERTRPVFC